MNCKSLLLVLSLHTPFVSGQNLQLFEALDSDLSFPAAPQQSNTAAAADVTPAFTLRSLSRFADRYEAVLLDRGGQPIRASWRLGEVATIAVGYMVQAGAPGSVVLQYPPNDSCIPVRDSGVMCDNNALGRLTLVTARQNQGNLENALSMRSRQQSAAPAYPFEARVINMSQEELRELRATRRQGNELRLRRDDEERGDANEFPFQPQGMRTIQPAFGGRGAR